MIIQGSHLGMSVMQQVFTQKQRGHISQTTPQLSHPQALANTGNGVNIHINSEPSPANNTFEKYEHQDDATLGETLAHEIIRRMGDPKDIQKNNEDLSELQHSLAQTFEWIRDQYGDEAGAAAAGMMLHATSHEVTEESLGNGLLNTLKFIDRQFGVVAGDQTIDQFNQGINAELNEFFDNGKNEMFHVAKAAKQEIPLRNVLRASLQNTNADDNSVSATKRLLDELKKDIETQAKINSLASQQTRELNPAKQNIAQIIASYGQDVTPREPQFAQFTV